MRDKLGETLRRRLWEEHHSGKPDPETDEDVASVAPRPLASRLTQWIGGLVSVSLVIGAIFWVFELGRRDANEVPVIKAMSGEARETPEDSSGPIVENQGLQVNEVLAGDETAPIEAETRLAPPPQRLTAADATPAPPPEPAPATPATITLGQTPQADTGFQLPPSLPDADPNMTRAVRRVMPEALSPTAELLSNAIADAVSEVVNEAAAENTTAPVPEAVQPDSIETPTENRPAPDTPPEAAGEVMIQLGAYDDEATANSDWNAAIEDNQDLMGRLVRFVERREAGGRVFYRLRARGFTSMDQATALCDALLKRDVPCIAVTAR